MNYDFISYQLLLS